MASTIQLEIPTTEEAAAQLERERVSNERRERERLAAANRAAGYADPEPGARLYVTTARGIPRRSRAGCTFTDSDRTLVLVVGDDHPVGRIKDDKGAEIGGFWVHAHGAEMILADNALTVATQNATEAEASDMRKQLAAKDAEIVALKAEHARALREARMAAKDDPNGGPARLRAARGVKSNDPEFGGKD